MTTIYEMEKEIKRLRSENKRLNDNARAFKIGFPVFIVFIITMFVFVLSMKTQAAEYPDKKGSKEIVLQIEDAKDIGPLCGDDNFMACTYIFGETCLTILPKDYTPCMLSHEVDHCWYGSWHGNEYNITCGPTAAMQVTKE